MNIVFVIYRLHYKKAFIFMALTRPYLLSPLVLGYTYLIGSPFVGGVGGVDALGNIRVSALV